MFTAALGAADTPTADEQMTIDAIEKAGGMATIEAKLAPEARLAVQFDTPTEAVLLALRKHPNVGAITILDATKSTPKGIAVARDLPHLRKLVLNKGTVTIPLANALGQCKQLRYLGLVETGLTDVSLDSLKDLTLLEHLSINGNPKITDRGMLTVKGFERLRVLHLANTSITDKGLAQLKVLDGLRTLNVANTKVTPEAADSFAEDMPNLRGVRR
jgi:hypothetical protein